MHLSHFDIQNFNTAVASLYAASLERDPLREIALMLPRLIGGSLGIAMAMPPGGEARCELSEDVGHAALEFMWSGALNTHPCINRRTDRALCISDMLTRLDWRNTPLYSALRPLVRLEDDIGMDFMEHGTGFSLCLATDGGLFTDRHRQLMDLLRPHFRVLTRLAGLSSAKQNPQRLAVGKEQKEIVPLPADAMTATAREVLHKAFPKTGTGPRGLPLPVESWLQMIETEQTKRSDEPNKRSQPFYFFSESLAGSLDYIPGPENSGCLLLHYRRQAPLNVPTAVDGLSPREREVLHWLSEGKTNRELAVILGISPGTIKRHLENIYAKLGVDNRTSALRTILQ